MILVRPVDTTDIEQLFNLAKKVGPGMTTFPADKKVLLEKIAASKKAFSINTIADNENSFLMVLENDKTKAIMGTAGVYSNIGKKVPFYTFQILSRFKHSYGLNSRVPSKTLHVVNEFTGDTEVGTLILDPDYRGGGFGKLLSKSRYLLIAQFRKIFGLRLIAELRGWSDENSISPFWEAVGKHFFDGMSYDHADYLCATTNNQFIADLMPEYPIYVDLLPKKAQSVIGKPHNVGFPALNMLLKEGFRYENFVDIFDAGPTVHAYIDNVETVNKSVEKKVVYRESACLDAQEYLVCTSSIEKFRVCQMSVGFLSNDRVALKKSIADNLHIKEGDTVRLYPL